MTSLCLNLCNLTIVNFLSLLCLCRPFHDDNLKTTKYIRNFVAELHPNLENRDTLINRKFQPNFWLWFYSFCETWFTLHIQIYISVMCLHTYFIGFYVTGQCIYCFLWSFFVLCFADVENIKMFNFCLFFYV